MAGFNLGVIDGRAVLIEKGRARDVAQHAPDLFGPDPMTLLRQWSDFSAWACEQRLDDSDRSFTDADLGLCVPAAPNVYGIGVNYHDHIAEAGMDVPQTPMVFAKFTSCITHGTGEIPLTSNRVDWEAELVVVIGDGGRDIDAGDWNRAVAGFCVGQDISDRRQQFSSKPPQFSLGKSARGFGPIGPYITSLGSFKNPDDLAISCAIDGETMQSSRTGKMIFPVGELIAHISRWCELLPGDLIFTGTPGGTGGLQDPRRYLAPGETLKTTIEGIGSITNTCTAPINA